MGWDDAPAGTATMFHVTQTGGISSAKARMDVPTYWDTDGSSESVCDSTRSQWADYYELGDSSYDFSFELTASGSYCINFYSMDAEANIWYLRTTAVVEVNDEARPSVTQIVNNAVAQCYVETAGSECDAALWLHDSVMDQLEYDRGHTWNAVRIDGKWCQMDLTWDDTSDNWYGDLDQRRLYFGLTDELMAIAHSDHTANYQADERASAYAERIQEHFDAKETRFSIDADNDGFPPSISGIQNAIAAYAMNQREWSTVDVAVALTVTSNVAMNSRLHGLTDTTLK